MQTTTDPTLTKPDQTRLLIEGGHALKGHLPVSGAKNSALALMAGSLLASGPSIIHNVPDLADIATLGRLLQSLGVGVQRVGGTLHIDPTQISSHCAPYEMVSQLRASFFILGPLLARLGQVQIPLPGGCAIGARPVDLHVRGLAALGAKVKIEGGIVEAQATRLQGAKVYLDYPSVGATETIMMAATLAQGETLIENAACEPEVVDLANFCISMGAKIQGAGTAQILIQGQKRLHGTEYSVIPDRVEAVTLLIAGAITNSVLTVGPIVLDHLSAPLTKLRDIGYRIEAVAADTLQISPGEFRQGVDLETLPFPGFPTDMQAQFVALLAIAEGTSVVTETVFENRLGHVAELRRMGADIRTRANIAIVQGVPQLSGAPVQATDLRASAALILAGLAAQGQTEVRGLQHLERGYQDLEGKLRNVGARLQRITLPG
ncbi:UDP-N-acetylglucosamine 1-carboxyvinyltransferase [Candidatus Cyanaurora vandensis]|uniref:UDP-N-acetylglucosamine 1-carboxyvinyltransferase n=1 Tax=Candidatus Cyanaurora vandensis TaxID=2714958 RepID=UPI0025794DB9|nr:UDP-N-acetylglucosamine 1-carboxyvinyltransferase [Candidatus Cyanaurora vandensis]